MVTDFLVKMQFDFSSNRQPTEQSSPVLRYTIALDVIFKLQR